ncbi:hypothetical protein FQZ97_949310 [compost metagenome]
MLASTDSSGGTPRVARISASPGIEAPLRRRKVMLANSSMSSGSTVSPGLGRSSGSGASYSIDSGKWSATHCRTCTRPNWVRSKPSADADTALSNCTYWFICCAFASSMALKTPLIRSVTKRGNDTAFRTFRVMPAMRSALSPNSG